VRKDYLEKFDILGLGLTETLVDEKRWRKMKNNLPSDFVWKCTFVKKEYRKGRVKGEIMIAVRKS